MKIFCLRNFFEQSLYEHKNNDAKEEKKLPEIEFVFDFYAA